MSSWVVDNPEKGKIFFINRDECELYYINYEFLELWDYGDKVYIRFLVFDWINNPTYINYVAIVNGRREQDFYPALRFFIQLFSKRAPKPKLPGGNLLVGEQIKGYQFPNKLELDVISVGVIDSLDVFGSYRPGLGLSIIDLMVSIDANEKTLMRATNRLIDRGILENVSSMNWGSRYVIADYDKADKYLQKHRRDYSFQDNRKGKESISRRKVIYTLIGFDDETTLGQDGVSYKLIYKVVDSDLMGTAEESTATTHGIVGISGTRTLQSIWKISPDNYKKVLFEIMRRKLESEIRAGRYDIENISLNSKNAPKEPPYKPDMISIELNKPVEIEIEAFRIVNTISMKWDAFICHASEDKEAFVRPLAEALQEESLEIWYDEFTLLVGDNLRRKIDDGLARSRFGVVILSPSFFEKEWPQKELDGLFQKEVKGGKVILPVWHNVNVEDVRRYSVILADRVGVSSSKGLEHVVEELLKAMQYDQSRKILK